MFADEAVSGNDRVDHHAAGARVSTSPETN
jgi:hypothetical protein